MQRIVTSLFALVMVSGFTVTGYAQLIDRGSGMIYDADQDITWLQDANYARTSGFDTDGRMTWDVAKTWAESLVFGGFDDWRLPTADPDCTPTGNGSDCIFNEMGYLYVIHFGNNAPDRASPDPLFHNVHTGSTQYWTGTPLPKAPSVLAFYFHFNNGFQAGSFLTESLFAWPVRDGDVVPIIPEYSCVGFSSPFETALTINRKAKGAIPAKFKLVDGNGFEITDADLIAPPVINVTFNGFVYGDGASDDAALEAVGKSNEGNIFAYNLDSGYWEYRIGTKQFPAAGTYTVGVRSGDNGEYMLNPACSQTFTRKQ